MCGIVGYLGEQEAVPILLEGLKQLEYRGYDSSGIGVLYRKKIRVFKKKGKIAALENALRRVPSSPIGIAHTRWATHGEPSDLNAHPQVSEDGRVAVVHNGIIDNYAELKERLRGSGYGFTSATDTEVIAQLIAFNLKEDPEEAVKKSLLQLEGTYGLLVLFSDYPNLIVGAKKGSPLVLGLGENFSFIASDPAAFVGYTQKAVYLEDNETVLLTRTGFKTTDLTDLVVAKEIEELTFKKEALQKGEYEHFLLKEIFEQPAAVKRAFGGGGRLIPDFGTAKLGGLNMESRDFFDVDRIRIIAMGSAFYAGMVGKFLVEHMSRIPVEVSDASELRYANPIVRKQTLYLAVSQSGETADTIAAVAEVKHKGGRVLGIINSPGSTLSRICEGGVYIHAGPEISVASTKAFAGQITVLFLIALFLGRMKDVALNRGKELVKGLLEIPEKISTVLKEQARIEELARKYQDAEHILYLGRGINYPLVLEGALKLKEISYMHAEGFSAGMLKHGPLALVAPRTPVLFVVTQGATMEKTLSNIQEVRARRGRIIVITNCDDPRLRQCADDLVRVPQSDELLSPLLTIVPLQLFAYYAAKARGLDVDQPRNLAKSVTTE